MANKKKMVAVITVIFMLIVSCIGLVGCGNMDMVDTVYSYNYAYILLPNGECVEGKVESWRDYEDGDQLQIKINGVIYLTDTTRAVLVKK